MGRLQFSPAAEILVRRACREAQRMGHSYVGSEHLVLALLVAGDCCAGRLLQWKGWDYQVLYSLVLQRRGQGDSGAVLQGVSGGLCGVLRAAHREARILQAAHVEPEHLLMALTRQPDCTAAQLLTTCGGDINDVFSNVYDSLLYRQQIRQGGINEMKLVEQFCEDMVAQAERGDPVIGRERETRTVMEILCRKCKNNPALIGEPGVGKTAIVEGLAQRMAAGQVPDRLRGKRLLALNLASLLAGTKYRGEFEERVRDVVQEIRRAGNVILFLDEMHTMVGAGSAEGAIDAANLLKPALSRGEIQVIGATTMEEYRKYIEKDAALDRRFRAVAVQEPTPEETEKILLGLRPGLEKFHGVTIAREAVTAAVELSCRYLTSAFLPDKAVDLLDESAAGKRMEKVLRQTPEQEARQRQLAAELKRAVREDRFEEAARLRDRLQGLMHQQLTRQSAGQSIVTGEDIARAVAERTGIPVGRLSLSDRRRMLELEKSLSCRVLGQEEAVHAVAAAVRRSRAGLREKGRPVASMLFMGPTGVGKTELCKALAELVFGTEEALIRLDMTEYMEQHTISRLLGAPPGYVGHGEGGLLTEKVRRRPYSVVLLDEIEKAHRDVTGILLQVMDDGVLTDAMGRKADFSNCILIMTSNLGGGSGGALGFDRLQEQGRASASLKAHFSPEFLGRIDCVAQFGRLDGKTMCQIAQLQLQKLCDRTEKNGVHLQVDPMAAETLCLGCGTDGGVRRLRQQLRVLVEEPLSELMLQHADLVSARLQVEAGRLTVRA